MKLSLLFSLFLLLLSGCQPKQVASESPKNKSWLDHHWKRPLASQGEKPKGEAYRSVELTPESCGSCHPQQFADWSTALHAKSMGPGLVGQFLDNENPAAVQSCMGCHAPLKEQRDQVLAGLLKPGLHQKGMVCAACHVREWQVTGPSALHPSNQKGPKPHGGFKVSKAFESAYFCASCHQFSKGDFALNGKFLENTYAEWEKSGYPEQKSTCQTCHMPDRRHLWRGIHDPAMVKQGLGIKWKGVNESEGQWVGTLELTNKGAGHALPTYVTPLIEVVFVQLDGHKRAIPGTEQTAPIGRMVSPDLSKEFYDTRLMPHESRGIVYRRKGEPTARWLSVKVVVKPDEFYRKLYLNRLSFKDLVKGRAQLIQALEQTVKNQFTLFEQSYRLGR